MSATASRYLRAALRYAELGFPVFPCSSKKVPLIKDWPNKASTDPTQIRDWWAKWPNAFVAIVTGERSGVMVLDADSTEADQALSSFEATHGDLPETVEQTTPRGYQLLFAHQSGVRNSTSKIAPGLDVRGDGGFVVLPPAHNRKWIHAPWNCDLQQAPDWLAQLMLNGNHQSNGHSDNWQPLDIEAIFDGVPHHQRDDTAFRYAKSMRSTQCTKSRKR